eukprot:g30543.t1
MDELRSRLTYQRELRDCCVLCFTETWLTPAIPDCTLQGDRFSIHCMASLSKAKDGGICSLINTSWCLDVVALANHCSLDLEYLIVKHHPYYKSREFTSAILIAVYIPPHADVKNALDVIYTTTNTLETKFPKPLFIVAGNFNQANLKQILPKYHPHISCPTRGEPNILDHSYMTIKDAYSSISRPHFGKFNHSTAPKDCFWDSLDTVNGTMFKCSAENLDEYVTTVTDFISKCVEGHEPKKSIQAAISDDSKTKELIINFRKKEGEHAPIYINGTEVERVKSVKFLGVTITNDFP